jgi:hypothetical protein
MTTDHRFNVVIVSAGHGVGQDATANPGKVVHYTGLKTGTRF